METVQPSDRVNYINVKSAVNWDEYFMLQAMLASFKSKDPSTKVGAVFVDHLHHQVSMGYNGLVAGIDEASLPWGNDKNVPLRDQKYAYVVHAEANAILHAPSSLAGTVLYVTLFPCHECAKLLATKKVKEIVYFSDKYNATEDGYIARKILDAAGISYRKLVISKAIISQLSIFLNDQLECTGESSVSYS